MYRYMYVYMCALYIYIHIQLDYICNVLNVIYIRLQNYKITRLQGYKMSPTEVLSGTAV